MDAKSRASTGVAEDEAPDVLCGAIDDLFGALAVDL
jgi:hypothetical protein